MGKMLCGILFTYIFRYFKYENHNKEHTGEIEAVISVNLTLLSTNRFLTFQVSLPGQAIR